MMASLAASGTHDHLEFEWIAFAGSLDLVHPAPFGHVRTGPRQFDELRSAAPTEMRIGDSILMISDGGGVRLAMPAVVAVGARRAHGMNGNPRYKTREG